MRRHVVVDGSNIATEGRSTPSLAQLDQAVREFLDEFAGVTVTVVVDATFGHRIDPSEQKAFDEAEANAEVVSPPAGAIGRGDAFVLRIADKVGGTILSNDSFQEFHGEYEWLFDEGRLIGGKPVPGVGWVFTLRTPVRGPKSRESVKEAKRKKAKQQDGHEQGLELAARTREAKPKSRRQVEKAIEVATDEVVEPDSAKANRRRRRRSAAPPSEPLNDPTTFFDFVTANRPGATVMGEVDAFTSHGAFVTVGPARCYIPLGAMSDPPPRAAKEVLKRGETREFVIQALDPPRRGIELALPGVAHVSGAPTEETVEAEIHERPELQPAKPARGGRRRRGAEPEVVPAEGADGASAVESVEAILEAAAELVAPGGGADATVAGVTPARGTRRRKAAAPTAEAAPAQTEVAPSDAGPSDGGADEVAAAPASRVTKRTPRKRLSPPAEAAKPRTAAPAGQADEVPPTEAPAKPARGRKKAAAPVVDVPPAPPLAAVTQPAAPARARGRKAPAPLPDTPAAAASAPASAPARATAAAKKASKATKKATKTAAAPVAEPAAPAAGSAGAGASDGADERKAARSAAAKKAAATRAAKKAAADRS